MSARFVNEAIACSFRIRDETNHERDRQYDELQARHENEDQNEGERCCLRFHEGENPECVGEQQKDGKANAESDSPHTAATRNCGTKAS
jgi:hypothetical protein